MYLREYYLDFVESIIDGKKNDEVLVFRRQTLYQEYVKYVGTKDNGNMYTMSINMFGDKNNCHFIISARVTKEQTDPTYVHGKENRVTAKKVFIYETNKNWIKEQRECNGFIKN